MKILFLIHALEGGGAESQLRYLSAGLASLGHEMHVGYVEGNPSLLDGTGVRMHALRGGSNHSPLALLEVHRLIAAIKPDLVQTWTLRFDVLVGVCRLLRRFVWVIRESNDLMAEAPTLKERLRLRLGRRADSVVANSPGGADYWRRHRGRDVCVIENGYDMSLLDVARAAGPSETRPYLCYLGRLTPHKRVDRLIAAFARLDKEGVSLEVMGDGTEADALREQAARTGADIRFHGFLPHQQALEIVRGGRALLLLSDYEGTPNVVLEAQYLGTPVILSASDSHKRFFSQATATMVDSSDTSAVVAAMKMALEGSDDMMARAAAAQQFAAGWTREKMVRRYDDWYRHVYAGARGSV